MFICRKTVSTGEHPMIGMDGRNLDIMRAVVPVWVTAMIADAPTSYAVVHAACDIALVTSGILERSIILNRLR